MEVDAVFLDRDGTIVEWVNYISDPGDVRLCEGIADALRGLKSSGCRLFLHTNQSGVGRGYFGIEAVEAVNRRMFDLMGFGEDIFDGVCVATDDPTGVVAEDSYRKPSVRFAREMAGKFGLSLSRCAMIGDSVCDVQTALNAGMVPVGLWREGDDPKLKQAFAERGAAIHEQVLDWVKSLGLQS
ncbi:MAG: HAD-IIIA family hydrolase [Symploca sp. SIO2D2]|nr:HAD-IIIA family hydrolase [Symploca sp. SIO2D2]